MPEGLQPVELPNFSDLTGSNDSSIQKARIQGDHATVTFAVPAYGSWYEHMLLINRNGDWYISGIWNSGSS